MQGQRGTGSFTETIDINHGATSSTAVRPQICWNSLQNPGDNRLPNYVVAPGDTGVTFVNPAGQERQTVNRFSSGGPSSSSIRNEVSRDEHKTTEYIWSPSSRTFIRNDPSFRGQHNEQTDHLSLDNINTDPILMQDSSRNGAARNINLNADYTACGADNCPPTVCKSSGTEIERMHPAAAPSHSSLSSGSGGYLVEGNNGRLGFPVEGRRSSCKRKASELNVGESSSSGSRRTLQHGQTSAWPAVSADASGSSLGISPPSEQLIPRIDVQTSGFTSNSSQNSCLAGNAENSCRNLRMRINPSSQPESGTPHMFSTETAAGPSNTSSSQQSLRTHPVDSLDWRTHAEPERAISQAQPAGIRIPPPSRNVQPLRWNNVSLSNPGSSSVVSGNTDASREESSLRTYGRNLASHPRISSSNEVRNLVPCPTNRNLVSRNIITARHNASASGSGTSSAVPSSAPWVPAHPPPQSRRLSEYVRRSLFSPVGPESRGQASSYPPLLAGSSTQDMLPPSGAGNQDHNQSNARLTPWIGRPGDDVPAIPLTFRNSAASAGGRRGRLVSEIRSVLDLMRRGEGLRLEDLVILDQSALPNVADIHDRHRDMRLDVDNMSYEELLALEERIGNVSTGLNEETIFSRLKLLKFFKLSDGQEDTEPCCICQEEYDDGDDLGRLDCGHDFHRDCIKQWLTQKNLCPICKTTGLKT